MKVLVVCDWFLKYGVSQAAALRDTGADVTLLCRDHTGEFGDSATERAGILGELEGITVLELPGRIRSTRSAPKVRAIQRAIRRSRPDIVHAHDNSDPRLLWIVRGLPRVTTVHDPVPHPGHPRQRGVELWIRNQWIRGSAVVIVHGQSLMDQLPAWVPRNRARVVPHGAEVCDHPFPIPQQPAVLLFGRLEQYKGVDVLLRAMECVWEERSDARLVVAGVGPSAALVPADPRIDLRAEYIPESELDAVFGATTLVALPYVQASQSGVGAHALGRGIPTIVSDVGSLDELALDPTFRVPAHDHDALARAILLYLDHDDALRRVVLTFAAAKLSWQSCARESLAIYGQALTRNAR